MITAEGVADSTNKLALKVASKNGTKLTNKYTNSGKTTNFNKQPSQTIGRVNRFFLFAFARRIPNINIHSGVLILPNKSIGVSIAVGKVTLKKKNGKANKTAKVDGFNIADFKEICFLSPVSKNTPRVNTNKFILTTYTQLKHATIGSLGNKALTNGKPKNPTLPIIEPIANKRYLASLLVFCVVAPSFVSQSVGF